MFELYKFVYWPSLRAKRLNSSDFDHREGRWHAQSDMIGGLRQYTSADTGYGMIRSTIPFSKVWIYGTKCGWCESFDLSIGDINETLQLLQGNSKDRFDTLLLYETDEFVNDNYDIQFSSPADATLNFIYYIENPASSPSPTPRAIPISIRLDQMNPQGDNLCSPNTCSDASDLNIDQIDINSPDFYLCGMTCNTSFGTFEYEFKGEKFGIIGTASPDFHSFKVKIDEGDIVDVNTHKATINKYSLLYVSPDLEYKEHTIKIEGVGEMFELYKFVYWPSLRAKRLNSSDFDHREGRWHTQSDMIGGLRQYTSADTGYGMITSRIWASHIWIYGSYCGWCESFDLKIGEDINTTLDLLKGNRDERLDSAVIYETTDLNNNYYNVTLSSSADATVNCIYYISPEPVPSDEIILNEEDCNNNKRCIHIEEKDMPVNIYINVTTFKDLNDNLNGNAIYIINAGLECNKSTFDNCGSEQNVGGAIYLSNELNYTNNNVNLEKLIFTKCKAKYGGAIYIHSTSYLNTVTISKCEFNGNTATSSSKDDNFGGSAIYLHVSAGLLIANKFRYNVGVGGSVKIINILNGGNNAMLLDNYEASIVISKCSFEIQSDSDCSLFYVSGKHGSLVELNDSNFSGSLSSGSHYINGMVVDKEAPKLVVNNCMFESDIKSSFRMDENNNFLKIDVKNQVFKFEKKEKYFANYMIFTFVLVQALALFAFVFVRIILKKKNHNDLDLKENQIESVDDLSSQPI
ncbi:hypothetical protein M9Y10_004151 [Tritrichomonas musculus]|uniref:Right handed beta helix domain-containing protein n=1 Tax=Tritrichomonas musculus TaxID=1915356 RepID=A0ABR2JR80_9EUKA